MTDMFYVLEGRLRSALDDETVEAPAGLEQYFRELAKALAQESFSPDLIARLSAKYDIEFP
jgi:hypothetical protein